MREKDASPNGVLGRIIVDKKPNGCTKCPFCVDGMCNGADGRMIPNVAIEEHRIKEGDTPPEWCPLETVCVRARFFPEEMYDKLCALLTNYENSNEYVWGTTDSLGWLDEFYCLCAELRNFVAQ